MLKDRQIDRQTQMKLRATFRNFVNAPHKFSNATFDNKILLPNYATYEASQKKQQIKINLQVCPEMINSLHLYNFISDIPFKFKTAV